MRLVWFGLPCLVNGQPHVTVLRRRCTKGLSLDSTVATIHPQQRTDHI